MLIAEAGFSIKEFNRSPAVDTAEAWTLFPLGIAHWHQWEHFHWLQWALDQADRIQAFHNCPHHTSGRMIVPKVPESPFYSRCHTTGAISQSILTMTVRHCGETQGDEFPVLHVSAFEKIKQAYSDLSVSCLFFCSILVLPPLSLSHTHLNLYIYISHTHIHAHTHTWIAVTKVYLVPLYCKYIYHYRFGLIAAFNTALNFHQTFVSCELWLQISNFDMICFWHSIISSWSHSTICSCYWKVVY